MIERHFDQLKQALDESNRIGRERNDLIEESSKWFFWIGVFIALSNIGQCAGT